mmetsp:Transcript_15646/g.51102  ORF Transcript_15646/g.51102 Transcript_15646/m.51102 type:complete len:227 (+) Transcript_15646:562-1242(+)
MRHARMPPFLIPCSLYPFQDGAHGCMVRRLRRRKRSHVATWRRSIIQRVATDERQGPTPTFTSASQPSRALLRRWCIGHCLRELPERKAPKQEDFGGPEVDRLLLLLGDAAGVHCAGGVDGKGDEQSLVEEVSILIGHLCQREARVRDGAGQKQHAQQKHVARLEVRERVGARLVGQPAADDPCRRVVWILVARSLVNRVKGQQLHQALGSVLRLAACRRCRLRAA